MSQPPEEPNPYESPHSQASEDASEALPGDLARWARRANVTNDVTVVIGAIVWLVILSFVGATTASTATTFGAILLGVAIVAWYWIGWGAMLCGCGPSSRRKNGMIHCGGLRIGPR